MTELRKHILTIFIALTLLLPMLPPTPQVYAQETEEYYWGRGLINEGNSAFFNSTATADRVSKEILRPVDGGYGYYHNDTGDYFQQEFLLVNELEETTPTEVYDDDETFWTQHLGGAGAYTATISEDTSTVHKGTSSLNITIHGGINSEVGAKHIYGVGQDWSGEEFLCLWIYGVNSGSNIQTYVHSSAGNYLLWNDLDNFNGWRRLVLPFNNPDGVAGAIDITSITNVSVYYTAITGGFTSYLDRTVIDVGNWAKAEFQTPDGLDARLFEVYGYDVSGFTYFSTPVINASSLTVDGTYIETLNEILWDNVYNQTASTRIAFYNQTIQGGTATPNNDTNAGSLTVSNRQGCNYRVGFALKMPPSTVSGNLQGSDAVNKVRLRLVIYYSAATTTFTQGAEYGWEAVIRETNDTRNWFNISFTEPLTSSYAEANFSDSYFYDGAEVYTQPTDLERIWVNRTGLDTMAFQFGNTNESNVPSHGFASLKEHRIGGPASPVITFPQNGSSAVNISSTVAGTGNGYIFTSFDRTWLNGKNVTVEWNGNTPGVGCGIFILDGEYDRASAIDFPDNDVLVYKGGGVLQTVTVKATSWGLENASAIAATSGGTEDSCTLLILLSDAWIATAVYLSVDRITIYDSTGTTILYENHFTGAPIMEETATFNDYGYVSLPIGETDDITLTVNTNYQRVNPFYIIEVKNAATGNDWTNFTHVLELTEHTIDNQLTLHKTPSHYGIYRQPGNFTLTHTDGVYSYDRTQTVSLVYETITFYLGDILALVQYDIWLDDVAGYYYTPDADLTTQRLIAGTWTTIDTGAFADDNYDVYLETSTVYRFIIDKDDHTFDYGSLVTSSTDFKLVLTIIDLEWYPDDDMKYVSWAVSRGAATAANLSAVAVDGAFNLPSDVNVTIYNSTMNSVASTTYDDVTSFSYSWAPGWANMSYYIVLTANVTGWMNDFQELKGIGPQSEFGETMRFPITMFNWGVDPTLLFGCILACFGLLVSSRNKMVGPVILVTMAGFFTYMGWLNIGAYAIYISAVIAVMYAIATSGGEK